MNVISTILFVIPYTCDGRHLNGI